MQRQLGVDQPDFGILFDDMEFLDRGVIATQGLMQPKIEAEIAFVMARDLGVGRAPAWGEFVAAIDHALPALEIVDSAIADWKIGILDTIADNASAGLYVLGDQSAASPASSPDRFCGRRAETMNAETPQEFDVAIIGLGPTGLTLAHFLGRRGLKVSRAGARAKILWHARAVYTDDRCMRIFQEAGVAADLEADGARFRGTMGSGGHRGQLGAVCSCRDRYQW